MCPRCSCQLSAHVATSSTYVSVFSNFPVTLLIKRWKVAPEFRIPNGATLYCHKPRGVQKAETSRAWSVKGSSQYPFKQSKTLIYFALPILSIQSNKRGIGKLSGLVTEFTLLKSVRNLLEPSGLATRIHSELQLLELGLIVSCFNIYSISLAIAASFTGFT